MNSSPSLFPQKNKIVYNTITLNLRVLIIAFISLLTTRLVLAKLGSEDYGVFTVIAGFTGMLAFFNTALATGTQRHIAFSLGANNLLDARKWFSIGLFLHVVLAFILFLVAFLIGFFLLKHILVIPEKRLNLSFWLYIASIISTFFSIISVPYQALFNALEQMSIVALLSIIQYTLNLFVTLLLFVLPYDSLSLYSFGISLVSAIIALLNWLIVHLKFNYFRFDFIFLRDKKSIREMMSYSWWNLFGSGAGVARVQGITILINMFFGPVANAAFSVAMQISSQISFISQSLIRAINPQIIKSEGANNRKRMVYLTNLSCKYSIFLLSLIAIPLLLETESILTFWLGNFPPDAVLFTRLALIAILIEQFTVGIMTAIQAIGKIALYQAVVGSILIFNLIIGYFLFLFGMQASSILVSSIFINVTAGIFRLIFIINLSNMKISEWLFDVLYRTVSWLIIPLALSFLFSVNFYPGIVRIFLTSFLYITISCLCFYIFAIDHFDRKKIVDNTKYFMLRINNLIGRS